MLDLSLGGGLGAAGGPARDPWSGPIAGATAEPAAGDPWAPPPAYPGQQHQPPPPPPPQATKTDPWGAPVSTTPGM